MKEKDIKPSKEYYIRVFVADPVNDESETGVLDWEWEYYMVQCMGRARVFSSLENALQEIKAIVTQKPEKNVIGEVQFPPSQIHRIGSMNYRRNKIEFRFSVIELDIDNVKINELNYVDGTVSFENPEIQITAAGPQGNWLEKIV